MFEKNKLSVRLPIGIKKFSFLKCRTQSGMQHEFGIVQSFFFCSNDINEIIYNKCFCHPATMDTNPVNFKISNPFRWFYSSIWNWKTPRRLIGHFQPCCQNLKVTVNNKKTKLMFVEEEQSLAQMHSFSLKRSILKFVSYSLSGNHYHKEW